MNMVERTECNRPHSRDPPSLHALNGINAVSRGFSGGKEVIKSANTKNIALEFRQHKMANHGWK